MHKAAVQMIQENQLWWTSLQVMHVCFLSYLSLKIKRNCLSATGSWFLKKSLKNLPQSIHEWPRELEIRRICPNDETDEKGSEEPCAKQRFKWLHGFLDLMDESPSLQYTYKLLLFVTAWGHSVILFIVFFRRRCSKESLIANENILSTCTDHQPSLNSWVNALIVSLRRIISTLVNQTNSSTLSFIPSTPFFDSADEYFLISTSVTGTHHPSGPLILPNWIPFNAAIILLNIGPGSSEPSGR